MRQLLNKALSYWSTRRHLRDPLIQQQLQRIAEEISALASGYPRTRHCMMLIGFSKSGKATLIRSHPRLRQYFRISTDPIHARLNQEFVFLRDNQTVKGPAYWERQMLTGVIRNMVLSLVLRQGVLLALDSCNLRRGERRQRLQMAKQAGYLTKIIWVRCSERTLLQRLREADEDQQRRGKDPAWVDLYLRVQKSRFQPPYSVEAQLIESYWSDRDDPLPTVL